jgi:hypothetical protein
MIDQKEPSHLQVLFEAALQDYENQTGIVLAKHPLSKQIQNCDSVESVTAVLLEQTQAFSEFRGKDKLMKPFKNAVSALQNLSTAAGLGQAVGLGANRVFGVSDSHPTVFPACDSNTDRPCCPTFCMCLPFVTKRISSSLKGNRRSRVPLTATIYWSICSGRLNTF